MYYTNSYSVTAFLLPFYFISLVMMTTSPADANKRFNHSSLKIKMMPKNDSLDMSIKRVFDAAPEKLWNAWSEDYLVKQWWGPKGFTCPVANVNFKEGGTTLVCMRAPKEFGGQDIYNTWSYQRIVPLTRIEYILNFTDKDGNKLDPAAIGMPPGIPKD